MREVSVARSRKIERELDNGMRRTRGHRDSGNDREGKWADKARGGMRLITGFERGRDSNGSLQNAEAPFHIAGLPRTKEGGIVKIFI